MSALQEQLLCAFDNPEKVSLGMYERYFGFKERPFRLVPDPAYLFLGRSHQEAMAHLVYTVKAGEGFVALTGEVGTGKTTLCRAFLAQLEKDTEVAYIFNPPADPVDLMRAVNRDFGLSCESGELQELIHCLNAFLIEKKRQEKQILLIIDEAQNLNRHVLEQIRLLSNLETDRSKLLQIILVGQPELTKTLESEQLRQLRQRITLRCRLEALSLAESEAYIRHRIHLASQNGRLLFTKGAIRRIFRFSEGIPRLINMVCDRGLLAAFTEDRKVVDARTVRKAVKEFSTSDAGALGRWGIRAAALLAAAAFILVIYFYSPFSLTRIDVGPAAESIDAPAPDAADASLASEGASASTVEDETAGTGQAISVGLWLDTADAVLTRSQAVLEIFRLWDQDTSALRLADYLQDDLTFFQLSASQAGMEVYEVEGRLDLVSVLDLPAILELASADAAARGFAVLTGGDEDGYDLFLPGQSEAVAVDGAALRRYWNGRAYIPWKNFFAISGRIPNSAPGDSVLTLKLLLRDLGYSDVDLNPEYDEATRQAVTDVQARQGIPVDGVVGSMTKIAMYNMKAGLKIPKISQFAVLASPEPADSSTPPTERTAE